MVDYDIWLEQERIKNDPMEQPVIFCCDKCGGEIYKGTEYYETDLYYHICENCFDELQLEEKSEALRIAGEEE